MPNHLGTSHQGLRRFCSRQLKSCTSGNLLLHLLVCKIHGRHHWRITWSNKKPQKPQKTISHDIGRVTTVEDTVIPSYTCKCEKNRDPGSASQQHIFNCLGAWVILHFLFRLCGFAGVLLHQSDGGWLLMHLMKCHEVPWSARICATGPLLYIYRHIHITLHYIALHYIALHCIALHCIALHYITLPYIHTYTHPYIHTYIH